MRGLIMTLFCLYICCSSSGQVKKEALSIYTEPLQYLRKGSATIGFDYAFDKKWSAEGSASLAFAFRNARDSEEAEHESDLSRHESIGIEGMTDSRNEYRMGICHWAKTHNEGVYMKLCCAFSTGNGADLVLEAGYAIPIWKRSGISIGYEMCLISIARKETYSERDINIRLFYRF